MNRDYQLIEFSQSLCNECLKTIPAKIILIEKNNSIYIMKNCLKHGQQLELLEADAGYYLNRYNYNKPGTISKTQTESKNNCPHDCGLCPDHDQHTCIGLIEITQKCDLKCPLCFASSGEGADVDIKKYEQMLDFYIESENGNGEILQISGGEPTTHPKIIDFIKMARKKSIKYVMLNTNGLRIARDEKFVKELSEMKGGFEIYLQFDGFEPETYKKIRGRDISKIKIKALDMLEKYQVPTTLVSTIVQDVNVHEAGAIVKEAMVRKYVRGINFQPVAYFGRLDSIEKGKERVTITGLLKNIERQTAGMVKVSDFIPLPCDVDRVAVSFFYKKDEKFMALTRKLDASKHLNLIRNTFAFNPKDILADLMKEITVSGSFCNCLGFIKDFSGVTPAKILFKSKKERERFVNENTFRISVTNFIDRYNFDMKSMKKECVHIITPDLKKIPFSAYNIIHRKNYV